LQDQQAYRMNRKEKILFILIQLFFITTISNYNDIVSGIITGGLMLCCILYNGPREKLHLLKSRRYIVWMLAFFTWIFISALLSKDLHTGFGFIDPRLPLLYFPLTIGLIQVTREYKEKLLLGFAIITTVFCLVCLAWALNNYVKTKNVDYLYNDALTILSGQQSIYISLLVNFSIYIYAWFIFFKNYKYKPLLVSALLFLFVIIYMLASRNLMLVLYLSVIGFTGHYILKRKKYLEGATLVLAMVIAGFLVFNFFPKTINRFTDILYTKFDYRHDASESHYSSETTPDQWNGANFRMAAWPCGWELFKQSPVTGVHLGDKKAKLIEKYKEKGFQFAIRTNKNLHNNYLDILVGTGMIGLLLFLTGWIILPVRRAALFKDYLSVLVMLTFATAMITEVYFDRSLGGILFGFFIPFLLIDKQKLQDH
jgi:O-antigen ligase